MWYVIAPCVLMITDTFSAAIGAGNSAGWQTLPVSFLLTSFYRFSFYLLPIRAVRVHSRLSCFCFPMAR
jgi:hypothetical protein